MLNWPNVIRELVERRRLDMAHAVVQQASHAGQELPDDVIASLDRLAADTCGSIVKSSPGSCR
jgi:hypothetical protein